MHTVAAIALALFLFVNGIAHFVRPAYVRALVPGWLGRPDLIVLAGGVALIIDGVALLTPQGREAGAWAAAAMIAVFMVAHIDTLMRTTAERPRQDPAEPPRPDLAGQPRQDPAEPPRPDPAQPPRPDPAQPPRPDPAQPPRQEPAEPSRRDHIPVDLADLAILDGSAGSPRRARRLVGAAVKVLLNLGYVGWAVVVAIHNH
ncbi:hypothetical protein GCM10010435_47990 [Winogradskya consettensis]|uniref:Uncharacterized protein n=1 Tax=Winogradskya consettensis TaxID=113560 RepID=A0A919SK47_9ACTN|nr:hypothetical protein [Actinoplanes consettensis]GIM72962.1 hypothetical protein Aco04nite_32920 [Actinoplanes consettensis]